MGLAVREIQHSDVNSIVDYWLDSDPDFLIGMGVDLKKVPSREELNSKISEQIELFQKYKLSHALIWVIENNRVAS